MKRIVLRANEAWFGPSREPINCRAQFRSRFHVSELIQEVFRRVSAIKLAAAVVAALSDLLGDLDCYILHINKEKSPSDVTAFGQPLHLLLSFVWSGTAGGPS